MTITFALLCISILAVWLPVIRLSTKQFPVWPLFFFTALVSGTVFSFILPTAVAALLLCAIAAQLVSNLTIPGWMRTGALIITAVLALAMAMHAIPGFNNPVIVDGISFSPDAAPFKQYLNFDKAAAGLLLVAFLCRRCRSWAEWKEVLVLTLPITVVTVLSVLLIAYFVGYVRPDFKIPAYTPVFLVTNLLFTCVAEEAFFRGLLQEQVSQKLQGTRFGTTIAILLSTLLFGVVHIGGGLTFTILSTMVGLGSACAYARTRRIEGPIITHFFVNAVHFVFFTYPFLK